MQVQGTGSSMAANTPSHQNGKPLVAGITGNFAKGHINT